MDALVNLLDLVERGIGLSVRLDQAVAAEISVVWFITEITAVGSKFLSVGALFA